MKTKIIFIILFIVSLNLNSQVLQQWVTRTDYSGLRDNGNSITCDNAGNSYVTGMVTYANNQGLFVIKYNSLGNILWQDVYFGTTLGYYVGKKILVDSLGFVYVTGVHDRSIVTLKYNSSGIRQWAKFYTSVGGNSEPYDMFLDNSGHIYVTGSTNFNDMVTIKYNSFGDTLWVKTLIGPSNGYDCGKAVIVDNNGNVYVTGVITNASNNEDCITIKYNQSGSIVWQSIYNGGGTYQDAGIDIGFDDRGNIITSGKSFVPATGYDFVTIKYRPTGDSVWTRRFTLPGNAWEEPAEMVIDRTGNIFIAGDFFTLPSNDAFGTVKYDSSGIFKWSKKLLNGYASAVSIDPYGNAVVTGRLSLGSMNYFTVKYNTLGDSLWSQIYNGTGNAFDAAFDLAVDNLGNIYVTGTSSGGGANDDLVTLKYVETTYYSPTNFVAAGISNSRINLSWLDVNVNESGFKIERSTNAGANWILKDSVTANVLVYSDSLLSPNTIYHYRVYAFNGAGNSGYSNTSFDTTFALTGIVHSNEIPKEFKLYDNYPNPFNPATTILFQIPLSRGVSEGRGVLTSLVVYDLLGREVKTLINQNLQPGKYTVSFDGSNLASGVYFYSLESGSFSDIKKMLMIK